MRLRPLKLKLFTKNSARFLSNAFNLEPRGFNVTNGTFKEFADLLQSSPQVVYCGFDPTAPSLHVGNLLALIGLIRLQRLGHQPIALVGGSTALIGDPTHRTVEREHLEKSVALENAAKIKETIAAIFRHHQEYFWRGNFDLKPAIVLDNSEWYGDVNLVDFMHDYGRHFRMAALLGRSSVQTRMESTDGMSLTEFVYQIFQSYDWLHLYERYGCRIQLGGNDQTGNILSGLHLVNKLHDDSLFGVTVPILTSDMTGQKIGKSSGGHSLWLSRDMTSPFSMYQYFYNVWDSEVERFLLSLTFLSETDIAELKRLDTTDRPAQKTLGSQVVKLLHGESGLESALRCTEALFGANLDALDSLDEREIESAFPGAGVVEARLDGVADLKELVMSTHYCQRTLVARRPNADEGWVENKAGAKVSSVKFQHTAKSMIMSLRILALTFGKYFLTMVYSFLVFLQITVKILRHPIAAFSKPRRDVPPAVLTDESEWGHHYVNLVDRGVRIHYVAAGSTDTPLMLFVHGFPEFWYSWRHQMREFARDYRVVAIDQRGYGDSDKPNGLANYDLSQLVEDLKSLIPALGYGSATIVAHDWGSAVVWELAEKYPDVVDKMIHCNGPQAAGLMELFFQKPSQLFKSWYIFFFNCPFLPEFTMSAFDFESLKKLYSDPRSGIRRPGVFTSRDIEAYIYNFQKNGFTHPINYYRANSHVGMKKEKKIIDVPTLIVWGTEDAFLEREVAVQTGKLVRNSSVEFVEGASHFVQQDEPASVNVRMRRFLRGGELRYK